MRTPGYFDYFEVTGSAIESTADAPERHAATLGGLADDLDADGWRARSASEGDIAGLVALNPQRAGVTARSLAQKGAFASGCLREFAGNVDVFDGVVNDLNVELSGIETSYSAVPLISQTLGTLDEVRDLTIARLRARYQAARGHLDDAAEKVARWLRTGPTDKLLKHFIRTGLMPLRAAAYYPHLALNSADVYLALAAEAAAGLVPRAVMIQGPDALDAYLTSHHDIAAKLANANGDSAAGLIDTLILPAYGIGAGGLSDLLARTTSAERRRLAMLMPSVFGNNEQAPFDMRAQANRVRISAQIHDDAVRIKELDREIGKYAGSDHPAKDEIAEHKRLEARHDLYEHLLGDRPKEINGEPAPRNRQVILFDAIGDGAIAELHGVIDEHTKNVGVYVPGTGHGLDDWPDSVKRSESFRQASSNLAMMTWIGSDLPDSVLWNAPHQGYAKDAGPLLSDFSHQLRAEIDRNGASSAKVTYLGHSYGGPIVGEAEHHGLDANRVLMVESAGMGPSVHHVADLSAANQKTPHYSMTAADDLIGKVQETGHLGADPDDFGEVTRLQTGRFDNGEVIGGPIASHSNVFSKDSDAWDNMWSVLNGDTATRWHPDEIHSDAHIASYDSGGKVKVR